MENGKLKVDSCQPVQKGRSRIFPVSTFFICLVWICAGCHQKQAPAFFQMPDSVTLQTGDIVFRTGGSTVSHAVTSVDTASIYSHVGVVLWKDNQWCVLHAVPNERSSQQEKDSVKLEPVGLFFRSDRAREGCVCRLPLAPEDTLRLLNKGRELYARHLLFDTSFNDQDSSSFYCSELVWFLYRSALGIDLSQGHRHSLPLFPPLIFCSDIKSYPKLQEIFAF